MCWADGHRRCLHDLRSCARASESPAAAYTFDPIQATLRRLPCNRALVPLADERASCMPHLLR